MTEKPIFRLKSFYDRTKEAARRSQFKVTPYGMLQEQPLLALTRPAISVPGAEALPETPIHIYISAGIHGDEPAGPLALLRLLSEKWFSTRIHWTLLPLMNPLGMEKNTRENPEGVDLNRDYNEFATYEAARHLQWMQANAPEAGYAFSLHLHEDWEAEGFYTYELCHPSVPSLARPILSAAQSVMPLDPRPIIDERVARGGLIAPAAMEGLDLTDPSKAPGAEAIYFYNHFCKLTYTFETPSEAYLEDRISTQCAAAQAAVSAFMA